jgi:predicted amidophosphoribosyltransferase
VANKKTGGKLRCASCATKLRKSWGGCPVCGRPRLARDTAGKAVAAAGFIAKGGAVRCGSCGGSSRPGAGYCARCGRPMLTVVKSAGEAERDVLLAKIRSEPNPEFREAWWSILHDMNRPYGDAS